jgi:LysR family transcriptional regulator, carnitine catabolism transcriptional activator
MRMNLTLHQLEVFLRVAELRSFTEAGRVLNVSQPALSRTIRQIEEVVGGRLFDRDTRNVELTPAGRELMPVAKRIIGEFEGAFGELAQFVEGRSGQVTVAALPSIAAAILPATIARFRRAHPNVEFTIRDVLSEVIIAAVDEGAADLGVTVRPPVSKRLGYRPLLSDDFVLVCRADDALAGEGAVPWAAFEGRPFVAMAGSSSVRAMTDAAFLQAGLAIKPLYECEHIATAGSLIAAGLGITALPRLTLPLIGFARTSIRPLEEPSLSRSIGIVTRIGRSLSPAARGFLAALVDEAPHISTSSSRSA